MNWTDLAGAIAQDLSVPEEEAMAIVRQVFERVTSALVDDETVVLRGFGVFYPTVRPGGFGRHGGGQSVGFRPGAGLKRRIQEART